MATIHVDGKQYEVDGSDNLLRACLSLGMDLPYFCWHPALGSVGACRQCAVKQYANADDKRGRIVMSCMTPSSNGTIISVSDDEAKAFRASVVELLMTNHPHDCPVCAEGGHCHLQDMTVMTGHSKRRYRFDKRTHQNQNLGPFVKHEMNRCIACYRCVRYYKDYAGGTDLGVFGAHENVYFGRVEDGVLESEFSGNLTDVCPTGVFTDKTHNEHYNRKWDMQFAPSVCQQCAVGCNTSPGERYGELRRIENRFNGAVNHHFLCDRGRFGYGYVNRADRPRQPQAMVNGVLVPIGVDDAVAAAAAALRGARRIVGIGSPRASLEANFMLRELVGADNFSTGMNADEHALVQLVRDLLRQSPVRTPALREMEDADAVLVLGEDVTQTAPRIALALRQAVKTRAVKMAADKKIGAWQDEAIRNIGQREKSPLFIVGVDATRLDDVAADTLRAAPEDIARLGFAVAHAIDPQAPAVAGLDATNAALAQKIAAALLAADAPLVVSGTGAGSAAVLQAAANVVAALHARGKTGPNTGPNTGPTSVGQAAPDNTLDKTRSKNIAFSLVVPEANSLGVALLGGNTIEQALAALKNNEADAVVVLENDLYRRVDAALVGAALAAARAVIVIDHQYTATAEKASLLLSAASFAEGDGTLVNNEGRAQRYFQVYDPSWYKAETRIHEGWRWLHVVQSAMQNREADWSHLDEVTAACANAVPALAKIREAAPDAKFRIKGMRIARSPHRYSGRTAMLANRAVSEQRVPQEVDSALAFSMEGYAGNLEPGPLTPFAWAPGWNSPQAWNKFQDEVGGHLKGGDGGVRLIEPCGQSADTVNYAANIPAAFSARKDALRLVSLYHLFGSEELSARAAPVATQIPQSYVALAAADAARLGFSVGDLLTLTIAGNKLTLKLQIHAHLAQGTAGLPAGFDNMPVFGADTWIQHPVSAGGA